MATILCLGDVPADPLLERTVADAGHRAVGARTVPEALRLLARGGAELIIVDCRAAAATAPDVRALLGEGGVAPLIVLGGRGAAAPPADWAEGGLVDYLPAPVEPARLRLALARALEVVRLRRENALLHRQLAALSGGAPHPNGGAPADPASGPGADPAPGAVVLRSLNVVEAERVLIRRALEVTRQNRTRAAALLGISARTLRNKLNGRKRAAADIAGS